MHVISLLARLGMIAALLGGSALAAGKCPQPRQTPAAPAEFLQRQNPLPAERRNIRAGEALYRAYNDKTLSCTVCHGRRGNGRGPLAEQFTPPPRNFSCAATAALPDGQLFWIIRNGSPDTAMPAHPELSDEEIWQLVVYLREFAK